MRLRVPTSLRRSAPLALLLAGCLDTGLRGRTGVDTPDSGDTDGTWKGDTDLWPPRDGEYCNGEDDDGDGVVDEGFPDTDRDGVADCIDQACEITTSAAQEVGSDPECAPNHGVPPENPWRVGLSWAWRGLWWDPGVSNVVTPPVVGRLTDDDGDGDIDEDDPPDVAFIAFDGEASFGRVVVLDGATGTVHGFYDGALPIGGLALADVDGNGRIDIVTYDDQRRPMALTPQGEVLWVASDRILTMLPQITVADLEGDGIVDVIADQARIRGTDGRLLAWYNVSPSIAHRMPAVADVDRDGVQDVMLGNALFAADGREKFVKRTLIGQYGHWTAIVEADDDPMAEIAVVANGRLVILEHDGAVKFDVQSGNDHPGAPCVADFDGDGEAEIGWASNNRFVIHNLDGTEVWSRAVNDNTGLLATCSGFDFDGNGSFEVLYGDNETVYIFDGKTGSTLYSNSGHASTTIWEYPTIADVDGDGAAEILVASNTWNEFSGWSGVTVLEHALDQWMPGAPTWHAHDYAVTNVLDDGAIPRQPEPSWTRYNVYRARPAMAQAAVDLQVSVGDVCWTGCHADALVRIAVQVWNTGNENSAAQIPVALYAVAGDRRELVAVKKLPRRVAAGWVTDSLVFEVKAGQLGPDGFEVVVDDDGGLGEIHRDECDESNNRVLWSDSPCPR